MAKIILFDGVCNVCNGTVQYIIKKDKKKQFSFASLQSSFGYHVLEENNLQATEFSSFLLLDNDQLYSRSTGALKVAKELSGFWPLLYGFMIIPPFIRDTVYNWIAGNRYRWFGRTDSCWLPAPELKARFIQ